jgi:phenylpyruvate tautomerase PptA (4-oxalocrotonate tautomerase family)
VPHLQLETTVDLAEGEKRAFADEITDLYAEHMETGTGHVAVTVADGGDTSFFLGRVDPGGDAVMLNAEVRRGRSFDQQRTFVRAAFDAACERWDVPTDHAYAVITEHDGEQFHEYDRRARWRTVPRVRPRPLRLGRQRDR